MHNVERQYFRKRESFFDTEYQPPKKEKKRLGDDFTTQKRVINYRLLTLLILYVIDFQFVIRFRNSIHTYKNEDDKKQI